jgi:hypothetical protein
MYYGYDARNTDPADRAVTREGNSGFLVAAIALFALLLVILLVFFFTFTSAAYCAPGAPCDTAHVEVGLLLLS